MTCDRHDKGRCGHNAISDNALTYHRNWKSVSIFFMPAFCRLVYLSGVNAEAALPLELRSLGKSRAPHWINSQSGYILRSRTEPNQSTVGRCATRSSATGSRSFQLPIPNLRDDNVASFADHSALGWADSGHLMYVLKIPIDIL